jgi:dephospho-CoA kinase
MKIIGIVGRIGAGKSTVARRFGELGGHVVAADAIAHEVLAEPAAAAAIAARFGRDVFGPDGRVDRAALARVVFGPGPEHVRALADLEMIVHPRVAARIEAELAAVRAAEMPSAEEPVVVLDVPLLVQAGWAARCDRIVVVECDDRVRRARLAARGLAADQQASRDRAWDRGGDPRAAAPGKTSVVDGSADPAYTSGQVERIWHLVRRG